MHFLSSRETAEEWRNGHPKAEILTVEEAHQSARGGVNKSISRVRRRL